jgi:ABC-type phosphate transport system substrate-binding protein
MIPTRIGGGGMKNSRRPKMAFNFSLLTAVLFMFFPTHHSLAGEVIIIANRSVPEDQLDLERVKNIFLGNIGTWNNNEKIEVVTADSMDIHIDFLKRYIQRSSSQFRSVWRQNMFTGKGKIPANFNDESALIEYVSTSRGAIGYVKASATLNNNIKVVSK